MCDRICGTSEIVTPMRDEIHRLTEQHNQALKTATFVGMTTNEANEYDSRRCPITSLKEKLERLQHTTSTADER
jgi:hypothetical protein